MTAFLNEKIESAPRIF